MPCSWRWFSIDIPSRHIGMEAQHFHRGYCLADTALFNAQINSDMTIDTQFAWLVVVGLLARLLDNAQGQRLGLLTISGVWSFGSSLWLAIAVAHLGHGYRGAKALLVAKRDSKTIANNEAPVPRWQQWLVPLWYLSGVSAYSSSVRSSWRWLFGLLSLSIAAIALLLWGWQAGQPMLAFGLGALIASPFVYPARHYLPERVALVLALLLVAAALLWRILH